jgi:hypothetical protein
LPAFAAAAAGDITGDGLRTSSPASARPTPASVRSSSSTTAAAASTRRAGAGAELRPPPPSAQSFGRGRRRLFDAVTVAGATPVILRGDGSPFFVASTTLGGLTLARQVEVADFDEDGIMDMSSPAARAARRRSLRSSRASADISARSRRRSCSRRGNQPFGLAVGDANGDHHVDVFALTRFQTGHTSRCYAATGSSC